MLRSALNRLLKALNLKLIEYSKWSNLANISGKPIPVYINQHLEPCFELNRSQTSDRVFILTIPKSGTYLIAKILENMGIVNCGIHIAMDNFQDNRFAPEESLRIEPWKYLVPMPFPESTCIIRSGQFAFGHIPHTSDTKILLEGFRKVLTYRNMRDVITSLVRYHDSRTHEYYKPERVRLYKNFKSAPMGVEKFKAWFTMWGEEYANLFKAMHPWKDIEDVFHLKFEVLMGDNGKEDQMSLLRDLSEFVGLDIDDIRIEEILRDSIGSDTITYSGKRSSYEEWWSDDIEDIFISYGFESINKAFGYQ